MRVRFPFVCISPSCAFPLRVRFPFVCVSPSIPYPYSNGSF